MIQFYTPNIRETLSLTSEESSHCVRVLRKKAGDHIFITDGKGYRLECLIVRPDPRKVEVEILSESLIPKSWNRLISLAVAPTKNADRMAWLVEKATEIGVDRIIFIKCKNSERKSVNIERLRRNAVSAMNQSLKTRLPEINEIDTFESILKEKGQKFFGYCNSETERSVFVKLLSPDEDVIVVIGPEGDFSREEVDLLHDSGFKAVTFGDERLRTETAALYAVTAIHIIDNLNN